MIRATKCKHTNKPMLALGMCRSCYEKDKYRNDPKWGEAKRARARQHYYDNKEKYNARAKQWKLDHPEEAREINRRNQLWERFGINAAQYDTMLAAQGGRCAICREFTPEHHRVKHLSVDHDHATGEVRELLCGACNAGLGGFRDRIDLLGNAIVYIRKHSKVAVSHD